jgi:DNA adenine methylase
MAKELIDLMPSRCKNPNAPSSDDKGWLTYVEPYFGGGQLLFANNPAGISEVVNDINSQLMNFWQVVQKADENSFVRRAIMTPVSQKIFKGACLWSRSNIEPGMEVDHALAFFVRCRQSRQALGKDFVTLSTSRTRSGMNEQVSSWLNAVDGLPEVVQRLRRVLILCEDAIKVIKNTDNQRTLFYLDPPYMQSTRVVKNAYENEMSIEQHELLLKTLATVKGKFMLSGYMTDLYQDYANSHNWRRVDIDKKLSSSSKQQKETRTECVWMNYDQNQ